LQKCEIYRDNNKEKIAEKINEYIACECGKQYQYNHKTRHFKTLYHINHIFSNDSVKL
jgi:hypothetical protein